MFSRLFILTSCFFMTTAVFSEETAQDVYNEISEVFQENSWGEVIDSGLYFLKEYADSPFAQEVEYFLGIAFFHEEDYEFSNDHLSNYLKNSQAPRHFEEAIYHKYLIAENFRSGAKKRIFKWQKVPVYLSAMEDALEIYDEVISTYPYHELAAKSLFGKAMVQIYFEEYKESIETFQLLIRRFPKHELSIESYIEIGRVYLTQCEMEHLDPNFLDSAENNYKKFQRDFPGEERLEEAQNILSNMKEAFAENLYETGRFYERTKKRGASIIYYSKVVSKFPETKSAAKSQKRLDVLQQEDDE